MIDEKAATSQSRYRWPIFLFFSPIGAILLSSFRSDQQWLAFLAVGIVMVCGSLWALWFGGCHYNMWRDKKSLISFFSHFVLTWLSSILVIFAWGFAIKKIGAFWGIDNVAFREEISSLMPSLAQICSVSGMIAFVIYWYFSSRDHMWTPTIDNTPLWSEEEAVWILTAIGLIVFYCVLVLLG